MLERIRALSVRDWNTLGSLSRGSSNAYAVAPGTSTASIFLGKEGVLLNDVTAGLVGHWKFDELSGTTVYDFSGNQNNGVLGTTTRVSATSSCPVSFCASFNGTSSSLTVPDNATLVLQAGKRTLSLKADDLEHYKGERGRRGNKLPRGFQRVDALLVETPN